MFYFNNDIGICGRKVIATSLYLFSATLGTFVVLLVFFADLTLIGRLFTKHIGNKRVSRLNFSKVLFLGGSVFLKILRINFTST